MDLSLYGFFLFPRLKIRGDLGHETKYHIVASHVIKRNFRGALTIGKLTGMYVKYQRENF